MSANITTFPESLSLDFVPDGNDLYWVIRLDGFSNRVFLSEAQADELARLLMNRHTVKKDAA